jgi:hypothetical protein
MTFRDIFGFNRITSFGPLTVSESIEQLEKDKEDVIEQEIVEIMNMDEQEIAEIMNIDGVKNIDGVEDVFDFDPDNLTETEKDVIKEVLSKRLYGDANLEVLPGLPPVFNATFLHKTCMDSKWANGWQGGATEQTVQTTSELEEIVSKASVCASLVESDCNPLYKFNLIFSEECTDCNSDNTSQNVFSKLD